jgi:hypothetical protein
MELSLRVHDLRDVKVRADGVSIGDAGNDGAPLSLSVAGFREDLFRKEIFVSGIPKINQNQFSPEILNSAYKSAFSW